MLFSEHLVGDGQKMFEHAAKLNWEGIISKRADAPYRSERNENWLKIKAVQKGKFPVVGFVKDPSGVAALYLGKQEGKDLVYMGKVGTGWSRTVSSQIRKQLDTVVSPKSKLTKPIRKPKATWVEPKFYADVEYRDITSEGLAAGQFVQRADAKAFNHQKLTPQCAVVDCPADGKGPNSRPSQPGAWLLPVM